METRCSVQPYTECSMGMVPQQLNRTKLAPKLFVEKSCETGTKTVPHVKMVPHCKNVTKQNCVTNWETDSYGNQASEPADKRKQKPGCSYLCYLSLVSLYSFVSGAATGAGAGN